MRRWLWLWLAMTLWLALSACTPEDVSELMTAVPTLMAPTPSATVGPPIVIDARVVSVSAPLNFLTVYSPQGIDEILVDEGTTIVDVGGHPMTLEQIQRDDVLTAEGPPVGDGTALLARRIAVRPGYMVGVEEDLSLPAERAIERFFHFVSLGAVDRAIQIVSPSARARDGLEAWRDLLSGVKSVRLLSIAQMQSDLWTEHWREYLVIARVETRDGHPWGSGARQWYVDVLRSTDGPWLVLSISDHPGVAPQFRRVEGTLTAVDPANGALTVDVGQEAIVVRLTEHTQIVSSGGWAMDLRELPLQATIAVDGLVAQDGTLMPDRVRVLRTPGQPTISLDPAAGPVGQAIRIVGENWPGDKDVLVFVTVPTARFQPQPLATGRSDAEGKLELTFTLPAEWPDGTPITEPVLTVVVSAADFTAKARAEYRVESGGP